MSSTTRMSAGFDLHLVKPADIRVIEDILANRPVAAAPAGGN